MRLHIQECCKKNCIATQAFFKHEGCFVFVKYDFKMGEVEYDIPVFSDNVDSKYPYEVDIYNMKMLNRF